MAALSAEAIAIIQAIPTETGPAAVPTVAVPRPIQGAQIQEEPEQQRVDFFWADYWVDGEGDIMAVTVMAAAVTDMEEEWVDVYPK